MTHYFIWVEVNLIDVDVWESNKMLLYVNICICITLNANPLKT